MMMMMMKPRRPLGMTCPRGQWSEHSGAMCSRAWCVQESGFKPQPGHGLVLIIPMHMMNREIIPSRKKRVWQWPL